MSGKSSVFSDKTGLERILFFSDAVMAIAITLLVIDLRVPEMAYGLAATKLVPALLKLWSNYLSYTLSFFIIGNYWFSHHRLYRPLRRYDDRLVGLNLLFLFFIALIPFSTRIISLYPGVRAAIVVYGLNILPLGVISHFLTRHAYADNRLVEATLDRAQNRKLLDFNRRGTVIFIVCIAVSVVFPIVFFPVWFAGFLGRSVGRRVRKIR
jgi:uncharacterized membrane protein